MNSASGHALLTPTQSLRSCGNTFTEKILAQLGRRAFRRLWSHPNLYKDQGKQGPSGHGHELCDLLVVCGDDILIFSDKACAYPQSPNSDLNWSRWYRHAVQKSAEQIWGAERWLRAHPDRVFLDRACTKQFRVPLPPVDRARIHRVVVAHGLATQETPAPVHPTLRLQPSIIGRDHCRPSSEGGLPLTVGQIDPRRGFIHVLDDAAVALLLRELDTITDLVKYLTIKEQLATGGLLVSAESELDLLGFYLNRPGGPSEGFRLPPSDEKLTIPAGAWENYISSGLRAARLAANRDSYICDQLIESMAKNADEGILLPDPGADVDSVEKILRRLALEPRLQRRLLAEGFVTKVRSAQSKAPAVRILRDGSQEDSPTYIFVVFPRTLFPQYKVEEKYREHRYGYLNAYCMAYKASHGEARDVIGIAIDPMAPSLGSEDLLLIEHATWVPEAQARGEEIQQRHRFLSIVLPSVTVTTEYAPPGEPVLTLGLPPVAPRRKTCPFCPSGKRFKNCCGRRKA